MNRIAIDENAPNLYLLGFMGTGKTALGRRIAERLGMRFLDSDAEIEKQCAMTASEIFHKLGEEKFREMERAFIESGHPASRCVVSCGGGLCCREGMPELLKSKGVCVVLFSKPEEIFARTSRNDSRPLLNVENPLERIRSLLKEREPFYARSGIAVATDKSLDATEERIIRIYLSDRRVKKLKKTARLGKNRFQKPRPRQDENPRTPPQEEK